MTKLNNKKLTLYLVIGMTCLSGKVTAQNELFSPYAHATVSLDDNVYLLSDQELENNPIDGQTNTEDTITELGAGFRSDISSSNQRYFFSANAFRLDYSDFSQLNFTGGEVNAQWDWYLNRKWDGEISYLYQKEQSNLGDERLVNGDIYDRNQVRFQAVRHLANNNEFYATGLLSEKEYEQRTNLDNKQADLKLGYKHFTPKNNFIALELRSSQGESLNQLSLDTGLTDYDQESINLLTEWNAGVNNKINLDLGYLSRSSDSTSNSGDYDGGIVDFRYFWKVGYRTEVTWGLGRKVNNTENTQTFFTREDFGFIETKWDASQRTQLSLGLRYRDVDFFRIDNARDDQTKIIELKSRYLLRPSIDLNFSLRRSSRNSSVVENEYDNFIAMVSIAYNINSN